MKKLFSKPRHRRRKKLINRQASRNDPEEYGREHVRSIQNLDGWRHL